MADLIVNKTILGMAADLANKHRNETMNTPNSQVTEQARELLAKETGLTTLEIRLFDGAGGQIEIAQAIRAIEAALTARTTDVPGIISAYCQINGCKHMEAPPAAEEGFVVVLAELPGVVREMREWLMHAEREDGTQTLAHADIAVRDWERRLGAAMLVDAGVIARPQPAQGDGSESLLRSFALDVLDYWPDGAPDGGDLQELAVKHGLLIATPAVVPCGEDCACTEFYDVGDTADCYRRAPWLKTPPAPADGGKK